MSIRGVAPPAGGATLFAVPFTSAMQDGDLALLGRTLGLSPHMYPTRRPRQDRLGFSRLDECSGLFLKRAGGVDDWVLEGRSWGHPSGPSAHEWHVLAAGAAHQLDSAVTIPDRLAAPPRVFEDRPLGHAANKRFAQLRRRMVGTQ